MTGSDTLSLRAVRLVSCETRSFVDPGVVVQLGTTIVPAGASYEFTLGEQFRAPEPGMAPQPGTVNVYQTFPAVRITYLRPEGTEDLAPELIWEFKAAFEVDLEQEVDAVGLPTEAAEQLIGSSVPQVTWMFVVELVSTMARRSGFAVPPLPMINVIKPS